MGYDTAIGWCDHTFNPWTGCEKISAGCANCYAEAMRDGWLKKNEWGPTGTRKRTSDANWREPLKWDRQAKELGTRESVFCGSLCDVFERSDDMQSLARADLFGLINQTDLLWLLLTKRPGNIDRFAPDRSWPGWDHTWLGASIENQEACRRIPLLVSAIDPKVRKFLSIEPLLGEIEMPLGAEFWIDWVIVGGESGPNFRPMNLDHARRLRDWCQRYEIPFFLKQVSGVRPQSIEIPEDLQIQEFPWSVAA